LIQWNDGQQDLPGLKPIMIDKHKIRWSTFSVIGQ